MAHARERPARIRRSAHARALARRVQDSARGTRCSPRSTTRCSRAAGSIAASTARASAIRAQTEWAPSQNDARHVVVLTGGMRDDKIGVVTLFARAQSGLAVHAGGAGGRERRRPRRRSRVHSRSGAARPTRQLAASLRTIARRRLARSAQRCLEAYLGRVADAQRMPRSVDAVVERAVASRDAAAVGRPRHAGGVPAERARRRRSARARQREHARLGLARVARSRAVRAARLRRERPALPLRREPALRRHAPESHAAPRAVPHRHRLLAPALHRLRSPAASPRGRAGEDVRGLAAVARRTRSRRSTCPNTSSVHKALLQESDSLFLSRAQVAALRRRIRCSRDACAGCTATRRVPGARQRCRGQGRDGQRERRSQKAYWRIFWEQPEIADSIVTSTQKELFPMLRPHGRARRRRIARTASGSSATP